MPNKTIIYTGLSDTSLSLTDATGDLTIYPSLFQNHLLPVSSDSSPIHYTQYNYLLTGLFLLVYIAFVWLYVANRKKLNQIIKAFYQTRFTNQNTRDEFSIGNRVSVLLSVFFVITLSIFISKFFMFYDIHLAKSNSFEFIIGATIIAVYAVKFAIIKLLGYIFQMPNKASEYMMSIYLFCNALGLVMLPLVICLTFAGQLVPQFFIWTGIAIIAVFMGVRVVRGVYIGLKSPRISMLYLFMYLCALEILPFILITKLVIMKSNIV